LKKTAITRKREFLQWPGSPTLAATTLLFLYTLPTHAINLEFDGTATLISGTDCEAGARYRFGTKASYNGNPLDVIVEITSDDNDYKSGDIPNRSCLGLLIDDPGDPELFSIIGTDGADGVDAREPWSTDLTFQLVTKGTTQPVVVDRILMTAFDLDITPGDTGADNILLASPGAIYLDRNSQVSHDKVSLPGPGAITYSDQLRGTNTLDCSPETEATCRGTAAWSSVSEFSLRALNGKAGSSPRLFQFSFEVGYFEEMDLGFDYGDAPASYGEASASIDVNKLLGFGLPPDDDTTSQPSVDALGDDSDTTHSIDFDDDEAVSLNGTTLQGQTLYQSRNYSLHVAAYGIGKLNAFFDWNSDGDFDDANEHVIKDYGIVTGTTNIDIQVPATAAIDSTSFARFRFCATANSCNTPTGYADSGEIEDYQILIGASDADGDTVPDNIDIDDDNDGILDTVEGNGAIDTDSDGIADSLDLDSDNDGIPDLAETGVEYRLLDSNGDGRIDNTFPVGANGLADEIETVPGSGQPDYDNDKRGDTPVNSDNDTIPDFRDLDSDNDSLNDLIEAGGSDTDGNAVVDTPTDGNQDGLADTIAATPLADPDQDNDSLPDRREPDADNDGTFDLVTASNAALDGNGDGQVDDSTDSDGDGIPNVIDGRPATFGDSPLPGNPANVDSDNDGIPDATEGTADLDSDGIANYRDLDSDNDGILDKVETAADFDRDGTPNYLDSDADGDGIRDIEESGLNEAEQASLDNNHDGVLDATLGFGNNGLADQLETAAESGLPDYAGNGQAAPVADSDNDGRPDFLDLDSDNDGITDPLEAGYTDADGNGMLDAGQTGDGTNNPADTDKDGIADYRDLDSDDDGITDIIEAGSKDTDHNGRRDSFGDTDGNGYDDSLQSAPLPVPDSDLDRIRNFRDLDSDNDSLPDSQEARANSQLTQATPTDHADINLDGWNDHHDISLGGAVLPLPDTDADGQPDYLDLDADNDGINDIIESGGKDTDNDGKVDAWSDIDSDGIPDTVDADFTKGADSDGDGIEDTADIDFAANSGATDSDADGIIDSRDSDADGDGFIDVLGDGGSRILDTDNNGVPDYRETQAINTGLDGSGIGGLGWISLIGMLPLLRRKAATRSDKESSSGIRQRKYSANHRISE